MVAEAGQIGSLRCHAARLTATAANDGDELVDPLLRLAVAAGELFEDDPLVLGQLFAHAGDQQDTPRLPRVAGQGIAEQVRILQGLAQGDLRPHSAASTCSR